MGCRRTLHREQVSPWLGWSHPGWGNPHLGVRRGYPGALGRGAAGAEARVAITSRPRRGAGAEGRSDMTRIHNTRYVGAAITLAAALVLVLALGAGAAIAAPKCLGKKPTIVAGNKENVQGTPKADVIYAPKGDHRIIAGK